ncbi:MAG: coproporphyrinogen dehydrogenase HemZ [Lachnospiraceae bacterium]|nr:coproporphyrinogen dehydrogenase HemZ [Cuneatibacter sp.]MDD6455328.1 coproporphyrinogen dehydrogenase HemZ [Lachnospiraceae bacterium]
MLLFWLEQDQFEYEIRGLLMAFYPGVYIKQLQEEAPVGQEQFVVPEGKDNRPGPDLYLKVRYGQTQGRLELYAWEQEQLHPCREREFPITAEDRRQTKTDLKIELYHLLSEQTGQELPWGTLTGIRPTKLPMAMLEEGMDRDAIFHQMKREYLVSDKKAWLGIEIAEREKEILKKIDYKDGYSLYIGIPFCPSTCLYCSFTSYPVSRWKDRMQEYLDALFAEIDATAEMFAGKKLNTLYFGGGTPTSLSAEHLDQLLTRVEQRFDFSDLQEYTVEAGRPDSVTREKLEVLKRHNVSRISVNPQTMKDETLRIIGRHHTVEQVQEVYRMAREVGFDNINMDLILGLPNESVEDVRRTMEEIEKMAPDNVTIHSLALKRAARLNLERDRYRNLSFENSWERMDIASESCARMGLEPYYLYRQKNMAGNFENTGFAAPGKAGIYNILIMEEKQSIVALGAGATTKAVFPGGRIERVENVKDVESYIARINEMIERKRQLFQL